MDQSARALIGHERAGGLFARRARAYWQHYRPDGPSGRCGPPAGCRRRQGRYRIPSHGPATGAFFLTVPPGTYQLKFTTGPLGGAPQPFPYWVTVTAVAGTTVTPAVPPITHDGIGRGTLRWTLDGKPYTARASIKVYGEGAYFNLWGRSEEFSPTSDVKEVTLVLPQQTERGPLFAGVGTYPLGGPGRVTAFGKSIVYPTNEPVIFWDYISTYAATPTGTAQLTRYDAERGLAVGTFAFNTTWTTGALVGTPAPTATVTNGEFDITF